MFTKVPFDELSFRLVRFRAEMDRKHPDWELAIVFSKINLYYFTGTMQDGMLVIPRNDEATLWVRRSYERALNESLFPVIKPMDSFREASSFHKNLTDILYLEAEFVSLAFYQRFQKYFPFKETRPIDLQIAAIRAVKSQYETQLMKQAGELHKIFMEERLPGLLSEGMSELDLASAIWSEMLKLGHHGVARFGMTDTEAGIGHIAFGESSLYPTSFNGPGGNYGMSPAVPILGSRERKLKKGDLVFIDIGFGVEGYHTDKTMTYMFGTLPNHEVKKEHGICVDIQYRIAELLKPGAIPSKIYETIMNSISPEFLNNFMGFGNRKVKFLGHGIGLLVDEYPVIAKGFDEPIETNIFFAIEPKKGIANIGMVGIENTFMVTQQGGQSITGSSKGLIPVV